jgi:peptide/nickel transport system permease protein
VLLAIALGTSLALGGLNLGLFTLQGQLAAVPGVIIGVVYVPYVAKPIRGQVLGLREREFVDAARLQGSGTRASCSARSCRTSPRRSSSSSR